MPYITNPIDNPNDYDSITIGEITFGVAVKTGLVMVDGGKRAFGWDIQKGKGTKGAKLTLNEFPPSEFTITFVMWEANHFVLAQSIIDNFDYDPIKKKSAPQDVYHPELARNDIDSIVCKEIGDIKHKGRGRYEQVLSVIEYAPPPPVDNSTSVNGSFKAGEIAGSKDKSANDQKQEEIARLLKEATGPVQPKAPG